MSWDPSKLNEFNYFNEAFHVIKKCSRLDRTWLDSHRTIDIYSLVCYAIAKFSKKLICLLYSKNFRLKTLQLSLSLYEPSNNWFRSEYGNQTVQGGSTPTQGTLLSGIVMLMNFKSKSLIWSPSLKIFPDLCKSKTRKVPSSPFPAVLAHYLLLGTETFSWLEVNYHTQCSWRGAFENSGCQ